MSSSGKKVGRKTRKENPKRGKDAENDSREGLMSRRVLTR